MTTNVSYFMLILIAMSMIPFTAAQPEEIDVSVKPVENYNGDLYFTRVESSKTFYENGETAELKARVRNSGNVYLRNVDWIFYNNGYPTGAGSTAYFTGRIDLPPQSEQEILVKFNPSYKDDTMYHTGSFITVFIIDHNNQVKETSEANNYVGTTFYMKNPDNSMPQPTTQVLYPPEVQPPIRTDSQVYIETRACPEPPRTMAVLAEGEKRTLLLEGKSYDVEVVSIENTSPPTATFNVNGEITRQLAYGLFEIPVSEDDRDPVSSTQTLSDGTNIAIESISFINDLQQERAPRDTVKIWLRSGRIPPCPQPQDPTARKGDPSHRLNRECEECTKMYKACFEGINEERFPEKSDETKSDETLSEQHRRCDALRQQCKVTCQGGYGYYEYADQPGTVLEAPIPQEPIEGCGQDSCLVRNGRDTCVPIGTRFSVDGTPSYCTIHTKVEAQKEGGQPADNYWECLSNFAPDGSCAKPGLFTQLKNIVLAIFS